MSSDTLYSLLVSLYKHNSGQRGFGCAVSQHAVNQCRVSQWNIQAECGRVICAAGVKDTALNVDVLAHFHLSSDH